MELQMTNGSSLGKWIYALPLAKIDTVLDLWEQSSWITSFLGLIN